jgi:hypothetical protein
MTRPLLFSNRAQKIERYDARVANATASLRAALHYRHTSKRARDGLEQCHPGKASSLDAAASSYLFEALGSTLDSLIADSDNGRILYANSARTRDADAKSPIIWLDALLAERTKDFRRAIALA